MNFAKFKVRQLQRQITAHGGVLVEGVTFDLTNLKIASSSELVEGSAYTCTIEPETGYYLPQEISITGTASPYGFKYDYTTGVIYISSDEVIGEITITAEASEVNYDVPAVLEVTKKTSATYDGTTSYSGESFVLLTIYPSRGSTVAVTYGGLTKYVTGSISTDQYNTGAGVDVYFGTYNGVTDEVETPSSGTLTISGAYEGYAVGYYKQSYNSKSSTTTMAYCSCITAITEMGVIRYIPASAFSSCDISGDLDIPEGVTYIGGHAFYGCDIYNVTIPTTLVEAGLFTIDDSTHGAFYPCLNLEKAVIREGATTIAKNLFYRCNLVSVEIPNTVKTIGDSAFYYCSDLAMSSLPTSVTHIGDFAFGSCSNVTFSSLPAGVTYIGNGAFSSCSNVTFSSLPTSVTHIGEYAFSSCGSITQISLPPNIENIEGNAFAFCSALETVTVLATTPFTVGEDVFFDCPALTAIIVPSGCGDAYKAAENWSTYADIIVEASA